MIPTNNYSSLGLHFLILTLFCGLTVFASTDEFTLGTPFDPSTCSLTQDRVSEIQGYQTVADQIFAEATEKSFKGATVKDLEVFVDTFGPRLSGSESLEESITYLVQKMRESGLENVAEERVLIPKWTRGLERLTMISPRKQSMAILGVGKSVPTPLLGIEAEAVVVPSLEYVKNNSDKVRGKILVSSPSCTTCGRAQFTEFGKSGAKAFITKSAVKNSRYTLAAGAMAKPIKIPVAYATLEDVSLIYRLSKRGIKVRLSFKMLNSLFNTTSRNSMGDLSGTEKPEEIVVVNGHVDSWDQAEAPLDDGFGAILSLQVPRLLKKLSLIPKRTIRTLLTTSEEFGLIGSTQFVKRHKKELENYMAILTPDLGCFKAMGWLFGLNSKFGCILNEIMKLQEKTVGARTLRWANTTIDELPTDVLPFIEHGVPGAVVDGDDGRYFEYHHTQADTMSVMSSAELDKCLSFLATTAYVLADMSQTVPRD